MKISSSLGPKKKKVGVYGAREKRKKTTVEERRVEMNVDSGLRPLKENEGYFMQVHFHLECG